MTVDPDVSKNRLELWLGCFLLAASLALHVWLTFTVGFHNQGLLGHEFRQTQTAISTYWMQKEGVRIDYPTPILGEPWSVPMEFPLYQSAVVGVSNATGMPLVESARLVSAMCFYLMLPGAWLALGLVRITAGRKAIILALILTSPIYIFYSRAFLIEAMGLATAVWWFAAFIQTIRRRSWGWLVATNLFGVASGLGKVTTFAVFLVPGAFLGLWWIWETWRRENEPLRPVAKLCVWGAGTVALPLGAAFWWVRFADAIKAKNPTAEFLLSKNLVDFNFGTLALRFSPEFWTKLWEHWIPHIVALPALVFVVLFGLLPGSGQRRNALAAFFLFLVPILVFSNLYYIHDYYFYANALFLLVAVGFALIQVLDAPFFPRWVRAAIVLLVIGLQLHGYQRTYFQDQRLGFPGGSDLSKAIRQIVPEDGVVVIYGDDWSSITPYYSQRKALMIRAGRGREFDVEVLKDSLSRFTGSSPAVLVLTGKARLESSVFEKVAPILRMDRRVLLETGEFRLYAREDFHDIAEAKLRDWNRN